MIIAIDPGSVVSAYVMYDNGEIIEKNILENRELGDKLSSAYPIQEDVNRIAEYPQLVIEMPQSMGMLVGKSVFDTCFWVGYFAGQYRGPCRLVYRTNVKLHLCETARAKDKNVRQALIDRFGEPGTKKNPCKLYGVSKDIWSALAVAVFYSDTRQSLDIIEDGYYHRYKTLEEKKIERKKQKESK